MYKSTQTNEKILHALAKVSPVVQVIEELGSDESANVVQLPIPKISYSLPVWIDKDPSDSDAKIGLSLLAQMVTHHNEVYVPALPRDRQSAFELLLSMYHQSDFLDLPARTRAALRAPGDMTFKGVPSDERFKELGLAYHRLDLYSINRDMWRATWDEMQQRHDPQLLLGGDGWRPMLHDLVERSPAPAELGSERQQKVLRFECPSDLHAHTMFKPPRAGLLERSELRGQPLISRNLRDALEAELLPAVLRALRACPFDGSTGVALAGGAALYHVLAPPFKQMVSTLKRTHMHSCNPVKDYDLFVMAPDARSAQKVLVAVLFAMGADIHRVTKTGNALTIYLKGGMQVQIVLRVYANPANAVLGFDIQACKIVVWVEEADGRICASASSAAMVALRNMAVWVDPERQSASYAARLVKYGKKGFAVVVPLMLRDHISAQALKEARTLGGMAALAAEDMYVQQQQQRTRDEVAGDYDTGLHVTYYVKKLFFSTHAFLREMREALQGSSSTTKTAVESVPMLPWVTLDPMRQGDAFSNCFHPWDAPFYTAYATDVVRLSHVA